MNIPIYRAKKIGLNNSYIIGFYQQYIEGFQDNIFHEINNTLIDPTTLAINFPDMLDSQGNKIFASLSKDGKGGDIFQYNNFTAYIELDNQTSTVVINQGRYALLIGDNFHSLFAIQGKVIGIQQ